MKEAIVIKCEECEGTGEVTEYYVQACHTVKETTTCEECKGTGKTLFLIPKEL